MVPTVKKICSLVVRHLKDQKYLQEKIQRVKGECSRQREWHPGRLEVSVNQVSLQSPNICTTEIKGKVVRKLEPSGARAWRPQAEALRRSLY